jgi:hypothetical protein
MTLNTGEGLWFQCANRNAFHDVHTHGNCSWSGVYCVQVDPPERRCTHPTHGALNGATRLYGPPFRMVISFNASIHLANGTDRLHGYRAA